MPQSEGGYVSLESNRIRSVYNATTEPQNGANNGDGPGSAKSMLETVKKAIGQAIGANPSNSNNISEMGDFNGQRVNGSIGFISGSNQDTSLLLTSSGNYPRDEEETKSHTGNKNKSGGKEKPEPRIVSGLGHNTYYYKTSTSAGQQPPHQKNNGHQQQRAGSGGQDGVGGFNSSSTNNLQYKNSRNLPNLRMPSAPTNSAEQARLLGTMPVDPMDDIELRSVQLQFPHSRGSIEGICDIRRIPTDKGEIVVAVQGDPHKPAILTYHDLGLNYATSFAGFFNYPTMRGLLENFCVYHVNAPGQEEGAPTMAEDFVYPTMDELAGQLMFVMTSFGLKTFIGFGIGAGANILTRFAIQNPDKVGALCLINCSSTAAGWIEWGYQTFNARYLRTKGMTQSVLDYLMWHHFGRNWEERSHDLVQMYKAHFEKSVNPINLGMWIYAYIHRTDLNIARTPSSSTNTTTNISTLKMPVMNITADLSPHVDDTVTLNGRLDPTNSTWMKISDCAMVLEEQPGKLSEAFRLFLQGEGYAVGALQKLSRASTVESLNN